MSGPPVFAPFLPPTEPSVHADGTRHHSGLTYAIELGYRPLLLDVWVPATPNPPPGPPRVRARGPAVRGVDAGSGTDQHGYLGIHGYLRAWGSDGRLHPLAAGQRVLIQVREHGTTNPYKTLATATTSATGYYNKVVYFDFGRPQDLRVAYRTPYQTIASDFYWVGHRPQPVSPSASDGSHVLRVFTPWDNWHVSSASPNAHLTAQ